MYDLFIVESPGKVEKLQAIVGPSYHVVATGGHICDLPHNAVPTPPYFEVEFELTENGRRVIPRLREEVAHAGRVIIATDPDREGEAIAWHLVRVLRMKNPQRITFRSVDPDAVAAAMKAPRGIDYGLVDAYLARRVSDRMIGYTLPQATAARLRWRSWLTFGRVQLPAVRLVVERKDEIREFKPVCRYGVRLHFAGGWAADWNVDEPAALPDFRVTEKHFARTIASLRDVSVGLTEIERVPCPPPSPLDTVSLIQLADAELGLPPDAAMRAAQRLFESGAISYPRSIGGSLSRDAHQKLRRYGALAHLTMRGTDDGDPIAPATDLLARRNDAHEAIHPTDFGVASAGATPDEQAVYKLIRARTIASGMQDAEDVVVRVPLDGTDPSSHQKVRFYARATKQIRAGWREAYVAKPGSQLMEPSVADLLMALRERQVIHPLLGDVVKSVEGQPQSYRRATLIAKLAELGIGRPSTYVSVLETIEKHGFVHVGDDGLLSAMSKGAALARALVGRSRFIDYDYTRKMEARLDVVAGRNDAYEATCQAVWDQLQADIAMLGGTPRQ